MQTDQSPFAKRIKRRIIGRTHGFFAQTAPGLEGLCQAELNGPLLGIADTRIENGGVHFTGKVHDCYAANLHLRTAGRILMRVAHLSATNFRQLSRKLKEIPWDLYLPATSLPEVRVSARQCRLHHTAAVAECFQESVADFISSAAETAGRPQDQAEPAQIFIRGEGDEFLISLDSSGALLYKRGIKTHGGRAPLRETLAAAVLILSGYDGSQFLLDPMGGSGSFALEAAMIARRVPAGWHRTFAFMQWPCFRPQRWESIRREAEQIFAPAPPVPKIWSADKDENSCRMLGQVVADFGFRETIHVHCRDFFDWDSLEISAGMGLGEDRSGSGLIVLNPPYGLRLGHEGESKKLIKAVLDKLAADFRGWRFALIAPPPNLPQKIHLKYNLYNIQHGGLWLSLLLGSVP